jgi:hypothetical protein
VNPDVKAVVKVIHVDDQFLDFLLQHMEPAEKRNDKTVTFSLNVLKEEINALVNARNEIRAILITDSQRAADQGS